MRQLCLFGEPVKMTPSEKLAEVERLNLESARIILEHPQKYERGSLMYQWATKYMARHNERCRKSA